MVFFKKDKIKFYEYLLNELQRRNILYCCAGYRRYIRDSKNIFQWLYRVLFVCSPAMRHLEKYRTTVSVRHDEWFENYEERIAMLSHIIEELKKTK